jgi:hypothetical protein
VLKTSTRRMEESVWLHCNSCYNVASSDSWPAWLDVVFTNCGHVFCHTCFTAPSSYSSDSLCPSCGKSCQSTTFRVRTSARLIRLAELCSSSTATCSMQKDSPPPRIQPCTLPLEVALRSTVLTPPFRLKGSRTQSSRWKGWFSELSSRENGAMTFFLQRRAIKVMRFQRGQEAALVRGLVRQIHRQKQESAVLWQHSPTQGSTDRYRVVCSA